MKKNKTAVSDAELNNLFSSVQKNNEVLEQAIKAEVPKAKKIEAKKVDKSVKGMYNQNKAFGIHRNPETKKWDILEIDYNVEDGTARIVDTLMSLTNEAVAIRRSEEAMVRVLNKLSLSSMRRGKT